MRKSQDGFSAVEALIALVVVGLVVLTVWRVSNRENKPSQSSASVNAGALGRKTETGQTNSSNLKDGWKKVSKNGVTLSYPEAWDATEEGYQGLQIDGKVSGGIIYLGFGVPFGYKYVHTDSWEYVDSDGKKVDDSKPKSAPANVVGADSTILLSSGDGGCSGSKIGFAYKGSVYSVSLPWECIEATHGSSGISGDVVGKDIEEVITSIRVN